MLSYMTRLRRTVKLYKHIDIVTRLCDEPWWFLQGIDHGKSQSAIGSSIATCIFKYALNVFVHIIGLKREIALTVLLHFEWKMPLLPFVGFVFQHARSPAKYQPPCRYASVEGCTLVFITCQNEPLLDILKRYIFSPEHNRQGYLSLTVTGFPYVFRCHCILIHLFATLF